MIEPRATRTETPSVTHRRTRALLRTAAAAAVAVAVVGCSSQRSSVSATQERGASSPTAVGASTTAPAESTAPDTTAPPVGDALDLNAARVFGVHPGPANPDTILTSMSKILGPPTRDTGWYETPRTVLDDGTEDCTGGQTQRILRWGDVAFAFWAPASAGTDAVLWNWTVGDPSASLWGDRHEPSIPAVTPVPVSTPDGVHVGTAASELVGLYGARLSLTDGHGEPAGPATATIGVLTPDSTTPTPADASFTVGFALRDGLVTGIGGAISFC